MTVNIGVDLHKTQFTVFFRHGAGTWEEYPTNENGYGRFIAKIRKYQTEGYVVRLGVESTGNAHFFKDRLEAAGCEVKVINTLKFKIVNESTKKTDKHDAATIAEFLEKDMLPEAKLCSRQSEQLRRLLTVRRRLVSTNVSIMNQIHGLLVSMGMEDKSQSLKSKRGRQKVLDALAGAENELVVQPLFETIDMLAAQVNNIEKKLRLLTKEDRAVQLLQTIPGCGDITSWTIRAYTDDIRRFDSDKKYASYAGLAPWVQCSNEKTHYGRITKRGPENLRTALVQLVLGMVRSKRQTVSYRLMQNYQAMKKAKGSGRTIIATARKMAVIVWHMLTLETSFEPKFMMDKSLLHTSAAMRGHLRASA
jgi:transposase